ncbi:Variant surface glycoprotein [Trypanosoma congolense IL3000]|uniref:Variant surface glycoprotein n=1 Tax=Trypanosoma congolense (strain IL3000) TaxID=1068625 RepID=F9WJ42_TRYCI|nr:Variant surface glycoprotein [Trypanosoma congolense IL3000]
MKMIWRGMNVMMMVLGVMGMVMGVYAGGSDVAEGSNKEHFELLCNATKVMLGVLDTVVELGARHAEIQEIGEKESEISNKINEIFFGSKFGGHSDGYVVLPEQFKNANPSRKEVCGSKQASTSTGMPPASESMATVLLCLCTPTSSDVKNLCELEVDGEGSWPPGENQNIREVFEDVWGQWSGKGLMKRCEGASSKTVEEAKQSLNGNLAKLESAINTTGTLGLKQRNCDGTPPCANVTKDPTWLKNLKQFVNVTEEIVTLAKTITTAKKETPRPVSPSESSGQSSLSPQPEATATSAPKPVSSQPQVEPPKLEARETSKEEQIPEPAPKNEEKLSELPQKEEKDTPPHPENNETSGLSLTSPKQLLLAVPFL